jgi:Ca-activated chloride channel family protein
MRSRSVTTVGTVLLLLAAPALARAEGWSWLRSENGNVREGNQKLVGGDHKSALAAYDRAARELPSAGGVHLDRGLALLKQGDLAAAREAFRLGTQPPASSAVRADAYYDLGIAFYKEADAHAGEKKHDEAQKMFREAADAFKRSMRLRPGDRNSAWNYELTARRIREQEEEQKKEQDKKDQQDKDKDKQRDQNKDQNKDQNQGDRQDQQQDKDKQQDQSKQDKDKQQKQDQQKQDQQKQAEGDKDQPRPEVERALDALQDGEQNLERLKAMNRAAREQRKPEKDW